MGVKVEITNPIMDGVKWPIDFLHMPVIRSRTDDAFFAPLDGLQLEPKTERYIGLIHYDDTTGDVARLDAARRHSRVEGIATECGMARGDPARLPSNATPQRSAAGSTKVFPESTWVSPTAHDCTRSCRR
jgi:hypothetical protein